MLQMTVIADFKSMQRYLINCAAGAKQKQIKAQRPDLFSLTALRKQRQNNSGLYALNCFLLTPQSYYNMSLPRMQEIIFVE